MLSAGRRWQAPLPGAFSDLLNSQTGQPGASRLDASMPSSQRHLDNATFLLPMGLSVPSSRAEDSGRSGPSCGGKGSLGPAAWLRAWPQKGGCGQLCGEAHLQASLAFPPQLLASELPHGCDSSTAESY